MTHDKDKLTAANLKGCPFCPNGGEVDFYSEDYGSTFDAVFYVGCDTCGASGPRVEWKENGGGDYVDFDEATQAAVDGWNTRSGGYLELLEACRNVNYWFEGERRIGPSTALELSNMVKSALAKATEDRSMLGEG